VWQPGYTALVRRRSFPRRLAALATVLGFSGLSAPSQAEVPVQRVVHQLPSANGHGAILLDLQTGKLHHFREHLFAAEEPLLDAQGKEVWDGAQFASVKSRDLLFDAYFGLRSGGQQGWLPGKPVDLDRSGYAPWSGGKTGGTGVAMQVQTSGDLEATQYFFAPQALGHNGFVMLVKVTNKGASTASGVQAFSLHNFHLGFGRPGVMVDIGEQGETISYDKAKGDFLERAFAGVVVGRGLGQVAHHAAWSNASSPDKSGYQIVASGGQADLPDLDGDAPTADGSVSAFQLSLGDLAPGAESWAGVAFAHHGDPFAGATVQGWLDSYVGGKSPKELLAAEIDEWAQFQNSLTPPPGLSPDEETLFRHSAAVLRMAQSQEGESFLRESLTTDGEPRYTRFGAAAGGPPAKLPATVQHHGKGAILASLPPGEWTVTWARDGAYAISAMSQAGMTTQARDALSFYLSAEGGRFQGWNELKPYNMPAYQISLVRYQGFGVEETDFNEFGPNLEFDGFGLMLWALRRYHAATNDGAFLEQSWPVVSQKIGDALVALIDPATGLIRPDSSIWETHWNGRQRAYAYTSITAARGLCDAAKLAEAAGDGARATSYLAAALALRDAIAHKLTDSQRALAVNPEELMSGNGYYDAAVLDAISMGLFDPKGPLAKATLAALDAHLLAPAGAGWSRNDDRNDHQGGNDLSPWGSEYDSAEWVFTDMRGAVATRLGGDTERSDRLLKWVREQSLANYLEVAETYDENTGAYKFNSPMAGFGAGAYMLALLARTSPEDPACGAYFDESVLPPIQQGQGGAAGSGQGGAGQSQGGAGQSQGGAGQSQGGTAGTSGSGQAGGATAGATGTSGSGQAGGSAGASAGGAVSTGGGPSGQGGAGHPAAGGAAGSQAGGAGGTAGSSDASSEASASDGGCHLAARSGASSSLPWMALLGLVVARARRGRRREG
jgi:GH15 family glucan-1,4-alpha-glucosidase